MTSTHAHSPNDPPDFPPFGKALTLLAGIGTVYFFSYFHRLAIPGTIFDRLQTEFTASAGAIAMLGALFLYIYGFMQLPVGLLTDRFGAMRMFLAGGGMLCLGSILFPMAPTLSFLYAARALVGLGASLIFASLVKALVALFPPEYFAILLGLSLSIGYAGGLAGTWPFELAVTRWEWRPVMLVAGLIGTLALIATMVFNFFAGTTSSHLTPLRRTSVTSILTNPRIRPLITVHAINFTVYFFIQAVLGKKILEDCFRVSSAAASIMTFIMMLTTIVCLAASGIISRCLDNRRVPVLRLATRLMLIGASLLLLGVLLRLPVAFIILGYCLLAASSLGSPIGNTMMKETNPPDAVGTSVGIANTSCYLSVAVFTSFAGWLMDRFRHQAVIAENAIIYPRIAYIAITAWCVLLLAVSLWATRGLYETHGRHPPPENAG